MKNEADFRKKQFKLWPQHYSQDGVYIYIGLALS